MSKELWIAAHEELLAEGTLEDGDSSEEACEKIQERYVDNVSAAIDYANDLYEESQPSRQDWYHNARFKA